jgi:HD-GYP domain-containing protein (c-di-GMP phosphodiesterase class II)
VKEKTEASAKRSREQILLLNRLARKWLKALYAVLRTIQFHDPKNQAFDEPIRVLVSISQEIMVEDGFAQFRMLDDQFFLNRVWIKPVLADRATLYALVDYLKTHRLGGVTVRTQTGSEHWRSFLDAVRKAQGNSETMVAEMNRSLAEDQIEGIEVQPLMNPTADKPREIPFGLHMYSLVVGYVKCLLILKEFIRSAPGEEQVIALRKAQRVICEMVDLAEKYPCLFALLSLLKDRDDYFARHSTNVMILALLFGRDLGVPRSDLVDLGMAALLFDVGKVAIPDEVLAKAGQLTDKEWLMIHEHPIESATTFLTLGYINRSVAHRVLVAFQHHWVPGVEASYPKTRRKIRSALMSEIVALADHFDSLTSEKVYRKGLSPAQSLQIMAAEGAKGKHRRVLLDAFLRFLGPFPVGTWVSMKGIGEGIVACSGALSPHAPFPVIYCPSDRSGDNAGTWVEPPKGASLEFWQVASTRESLLRAAGLLGHVFRDVENSVLMP